MTHKSIQKFFLAGLGVVAWIIAPLVLFVSHSIYRLPFLNSISESATIAGGTVTIMPICVFLLAFFSYAYAKCSAYDIMDKVIAYIMAFGFTLVAIQPCASEYLPDGYVGVIGLSHEASNAFHSLGAIIGFGAMIIQVLICFTKSDKPTRKQTHEKRKRNSVYIFLGLGMIFCLCMFILNIEFEIPHVVFWVEALILPLGGTAYIIKSGRCGGQLLADRN
jgi:hypothetical protein